MGVAVGGHSSRNNSYPPPQPSPTRGEGAHRPVRKETRVLMPAGRHPSPFIVSVLTISRPRPRQSDPPCPFPCPAFSSSRSSRRWRRRCAPAASLMRRARITIERPEGDFALRYDKPAKPRELVPTRWAWTRSAPLSKRRRERLDASNKMGAGAPGCFCKKMGPTPLVPARARIPVPGSPAGRHLARRSISPATTTRPAPPATPAKADEVRGASQPGATAKLGFLLDELCCAHPRLDHPLDPSGYGEEIGPDAARKADDMLIEAESGLASVTGSLDALGARRRSGPRRRRRTERRRGDPRGR